MTDAANLLSVQKTADGVHLVKLLPSDILDEIEINAIGREFADLIDNGATKLVVDFSNVEHLSSSALGMLLTVRQKLNTVSGKIRLCSVRHNILEVFRITNLNKLFVLCPSSKEALADLQE